MTQPSQFSLEEENFYKDIQDLVKKGSKNEKELFSFLERYKDLLLRAGLDDEPIIINFAKAGLIIEASAKVYGIKVDSLWSNLEHVLESLKSKSSGQGNKKKVDGENEEGICEDINDEEEKRKGIGFTKRRKKFGDALFSSDDFQEIEINSYLGKNINENNNSTDNKLKFFEKVPNMFIKNKGKKKKIDVSLNKCLEDKDIIRLRDWIISCECLLVKEIYSKLPDSVLSVTNALGQSKNISESEAYTNDDLMFEDPEEKEMIQEDVRNSFVINDKENNNFEMPFPIEFSIKEPIHDEKLTTPEINVSKESDMGKFANSMESKSADCLVDVDEVLWNPSQFQDVIPSKKMRVGKTNKLVCQLCIDKKAHQKKRKNCLEGRKNECLDSFFTPHVQPNVTESHFGILPDEELYSVYKAEMKLIEQLKKVDSCKNTNGAFYPNENIEDLKNFLGFDCFETTLIKELVLEEDGNLEENSLFDQIDDDNDNCAEELHVNDEFELPLPVTENDNLINITNKVRDEEVSENVPTTADSEYQNLVNEQLQENYAAKTSFAKSKELGAKTAKWFEMIADKIILSQKRGALNMKLLANKIMKSFPSQADGDHPTIPFQDLVRNQCRRDIPRYFFACLQLANEGNLEIGKSTSKSLSTDCMLITQLKNYKCRESDSCSPTRSTKR